MKKVLFIAMYLLLVSIGSNAQEKRQLSLQFSINQIELGYQRELFVQNVWGEAFAGIANQDINKQFDDFLAGIKLGYNFFSNKHNQLGLYTIFSIYIPNNDYYNAVTPVVGVGVRYTRFIGKSGKHGFSISPNFQYGRRDYKQTYLSEKVNVSTVGTFKITPFNISIGYNYSF